MAGAAVLVGAVAAGAQSTQTLTPSRMDFGTLAVGEVSERQVATFESRGTAITITGVGVTGEFFLGEDPGACAVGISAAQALGCPVVVRFAPKSPGARTGVVTLTYEVASGTGTRQISLTGTAVAQPATSATTTSTSVTTTTTTTTTTPTATTRTSTSIAAATTTVAGATTSAPSVTSTTTTTAPPPAVPSAGPGLDATTAGGGRSGPPGIGITVVGSGFPVGPELAAPLVAQAGPGCETVYFFVDEQRVGSADPDAVGNVRKSGLSVPADVDPGRRDVTASCRSSGEPVLASAPFEVTEADVHRSVLATSMPQADQVDFGLTALLVSAVAVLGLLVLIAFPAQLFNTTLEAHYNEVRGWFRLPPRPVGGGRYHPAVVVLFVLLSGPLWFAIQPSSGLDAATGLGALGLSFATAVVVLASGIPKSVYMRRRYGERAHAVALPGALVVAVACVVLSRTLHYQPGYVYGLVGGLALSRTLPRDESGRLAAATVAGLLAVSVLAWLALLPVSAAAAESGKTLGTIFVENVLAGIFWAVLDSLVIAMLPLRLLEGEKILGWSRAAWAALYGVVLLAFVHILLRPSTGYVPNTSVSTPVVAIGLFFSFGLFSFAFWAYFRFRRSAPEPLPDQVQGAARPEPGDVLL